MYFPEDFKKRLKEILPKEVHQSVDIGDFTIIGSRLISGWLDFKLSEEIIIKAFQEGREREDVLKPAERAIQFKELDIELGKLWMEQFAPKIKRI